LVLRMIEEGFYHVAATLALIRINIVSTVDVLTLVLKALSQPKLHPALTSLIDFSLKVLIKYISDESLFVLDPVLLDVVENFQKFIVYRGISVGPRADDLGAVIEELRIRLQANPSAQVSRQESPAALPQPQAPLLSITKETEARGPMVSLLEDWLRLTSDASQNSEKARAQYLSQVQQQGILSSEEISCLFFRTCIEKWFVFFLIPPAYFSHRERIVCFLFLIA